jgi:hypothetical protein
MLRTADGVGRCRAAVHHDLCCRPLPDSVCDEAKEFRDGDILSNLGNGEGGAGVGGCIRTTRLSRESSTS